MYHGVVIVLVMIKGHHWRTQVKMQGSVLLGVDGKLALVKASPGWTWLVVARLEAFRVVWRRSNSMDEL